MTWRRTTVNSGAGMVPVTPATGMGSQIVRAVLTLSAAGTIDFRDGNSNSLNGGPLALAAGQPFSVGYAGSGEDDAWANPIALTGPFGSGTGGFLTGAAIDWDFQNGVYQPALGLTVTRASVAYEDDQNGNWTSFAANTARITNKGLLVEEARTNGIRNNSMQGAVVGTPGTLPTNWSIFNAPSGITRTVVGVGVQNGIDYIDLNFSGTNSGSATNIVIALDGINVIPAASGQTWTGSVFTTEILRDPNIPNLLFQVNGTNGVSNTEIFPSNDLSGNSFPSRGINIVTLANAGTTNVQPRITTNNIGAGATINWTVRIGWPQLELGAFATSPIRTTAAAVTRAADVITVTSPPAFGSAATLFAACIPNQANNSGNTQVLISANDGTGNNRVDINRIGTNGNGRMLMSVSGTGVAAPTGPPSINQGVLNKAITAFTSGDQAIVVNAGVPNTSAASGFSVGMNQISLGSELNSFWLDGYITRVAVWPNQRLPNATLQQLTSPGPTTSNGINLVITGGTCTGYVDYAIVGSG